MIHLGGAEGLWPRDEAVAELTAACKRVGASFSTVVFPVEAVDIRDPRLAQQSLEELASRLDGFCFPGPGGVDRDLFVWVLAGLPRPPRWREIGLAGAERSDVLRNPRWTPGQPLRFLGRTTTPAEFALTLRDESTAEPAQGGAPPRELTIRLPPRERWTDDVFLGRAWAQRRLIELERQVLNAPEDKSRHNALEKIREQSVALAQEWSLLSRHTAFMVLESESDYQRWGVRRQLRRRYWKPAGRRDDASPQIDWADRERANEARREQAELDALFAMARRLVRDGRFTVAERFLDRLARSDTAARMPEFAKLRAETLRGLRRVEIDEGLKKLPGGWIFAPRPPALPRRDLSDLIGFAATPRGPEPANKLLTPTTASFVDAPLADVLRWMERKAGVHIEIDKHALDAVGVGADTPVTLRAAAPRTFRALLDQMLADMELDWRVDGEVILVTTPEEVEQRLETRVLPISDLLLAGETPRLADCLHEPYTDRRLRVEARIRENLKRRIYLTVLEVPLEDVVDVIGKRIGETLVLDERALDSVGIGVETPVTKVLSDLPADEVLRHVLRDLSLTYDLRFEGIRVTTPEAAERTAGARLHDVRGLVGEWAPPAALGDDATSWLWRVEDWGWLWWPSGRAGRGGRGNLLMGTFGGGFGGASEFSGGGGLGGPEDRAAAPAIRDRVPADQGADQPPAPPGERTSVSESPDAETEPAEPGRQAPDAHAPAEPFLAGFGRLPPALEQAIADEQPPAPTPEPAKSEPAKADPGAEQPSRAAEHSVESEAEVDPRFTLPEWFLEEKFREPLWQPPPPPPRALDANFNGDDLIDLVTRSIAPTTWRSVGGQASAEFFPLSMDLIVLADETTQTQVDALLRELRALPAAGASRQLREPDFKPGGCAPEQLHAYAADFVDLLKAVVAPEGWGESGGPAEMRFLELKGALAVSATRAWHEDLRFLLTELRRRRYALAHGARAWDSTIEVRTDAGLRAYAQALSPAELPEAKPAARAALRSRREPAIGTWRWRRAAAGQSPVEFVVRRSAHGVSARFAEVELRVLDPHVAAAFHDLSLVEIAPRAAAARALLDEHLPWLPLRSNDDLARMFVVTALEDESDEAVARARLTPPGFSPELAHLRVGFSRANGAVVEFAAHVDGRLVQRFKFENPRRVGDHDEWTRVTLENAAGVALQTWELLERDPAVVPSGDLTSWPDYVVLDTRSPQGGADPGFRQALADMQVGDWRMAHKLLLAELTLRPRQPLLALLRGWCALKLTHSAETEEADAAAPGEARRVHDRAREGDPADRDPFRHEDPFRPQHPFAQKNPFIRPREALRDAERFAEPSGKVFDEAQLVANRRDRPLERGAILEDFEFAAASGKLGLLRFLDQQETPLSPRELLAIWRRAPLQRAPREQREALARLALRVDDLETAREMWGPSGAPETLALPPERAVFEIELLLREEKPHAAEALAPRITREAGAAHVRRVANVFLEFGRARAADALLTATLDQPRWNAQERAVLLETRAEARRGMPRWRDLLAVCEAPAPPAAAAAAHARLLGEVFGVRGAVGELAQEARTDALRRELKMLQARDTFDLRGSADLCAAALRGADPPDRHLGWALDRLIVAGRHEVVIEVVEDWLRRDKIFRSEAMIALRDAYLNAGRQADAARVSSLLSF